MRNVKKSEAFARRNDCITTSLGADRLVIFVADEAFDDALFTTGFLLDFLVVAMREITPYVTYIMPNMLWEYNMLMLP